MKKLFTYSLILFFMISCKKDKIEAPCLQELGPCDCEPTVNSGISQGNSMYVRDSVYFLWPQFNPNDDDEIIFCVEEGTDRVIYRYNLTTNQKDFVFAGNIVGAPEWSAQGWIAFTLLGGNIWKIQPDGSGLTQVTSKAEYHHPKFNETGDRLIALHAFVDVGEYYSAKIFNLNGTVLDSFQCAGISLGDWRKQDYFISPFSNILTVYDVNSGDTIRQYHHHNHQYSFSDVVWINSSNALFVNYDGLFKFSLGSGQVEEILCGCKARGLSEGTVNKDGSKVIYIKSTITPIENTTMFYSKRELVLLDNYYDNPVLKQIIIQ